jgi:uncharacterized protein YqgV (UPF0045/DUF77 family)
MMTIQATVAVYPLGQETNRGIDRALDVLSASGLQCEVRSMQTEILGPEGEVFAALQSAFHAAAGTGGTVMTITVSTACPLPVGS